MTGLRVYVAGPISADTPEQMEANCKEACRIASEIWDLGHFPFVPHLSYWWPDRPDAQDDYNRWLELDYEWIAVSEALLKFKPSPGANKEEEFAKRHGIPVVYTVTELQNLASKFITQGQGIRRHKLPARRKGITQHFKVGEAEGYLQTGLYPHDQSLGEIFLKVAKQGSTLGGMMDAFAIVVSVALQYGVPLKAFVEKMIGMRFEPSGKTNDEDIPEAVSIVDYIFNRLGQDFLSEDERLSIKANWDDGSTPTEE